MAFQLKAGESVTKGVKRVVRQEIDKALDQLNGPTQAGREEAVHDARKRFKKIRAVLRLVRPELGPKVYRRENIAFRDAGRPLTEVRDAQVLVKALDKLAEHFAGEATMQPFADVREAMVARQQAICHRVLDEEGALGAVADEIQAARRRVKNWTIHHKGWTAVQGGMKRVCKGGSAAFAVALADPTVEKLHECRKQAKYLWHQLELLQPVQPEVMEELADQAHELADTLGDDHDLALLRQVLTEEPPFVKHCAAAEVLGHLIVRRRAELQQAAQRVGQRVYGDRPKVFMKRLKASWREWRSGVEAAVR